MRLLYYNGDSDFSLAEFFKNAIPEYAILSHTWEEEEVTCEDLQNRTGTKKDGYKKIRFCAEQAKRDGLQYFWVDTCCIDKSNAAELAEAINSMFHWYRMLTKCYVYLPDVSRAAVNTDGLAWESAFRKSFITCIKEQDIPTDLLPPAAEFDKIEALSTLKAFGFVKDHISGALYDMHPLVHTAMQNWLKHKGEWERWNEKSLREIAKIFPWPQHDNRAIWTMYLPYAQCVITTFDPGLWKTKEAKATKELL